MKQKNRITLFVFATLLFFFSCSGTKRQVGKMRYATISERNRSLVDSILQYGLDHEALYTLLADIKPMSSLTIHYLPLANADSARRTSADIVDRTTKGAYLDRLLRIQQAINEIHLPDMKFLFIPYSHAYDSMLTMQLSVVRVSALDRLLRQHESFFGQFGLVPGADPATVVSTIENAGMHERFRGYGYLFGYPDYAVDFFVHANNRSMMTGAFEPRNFFQIPVYARKEGYFVYAYPKDYQPSYATDSICYHRSVTVLEQYKKIRNNYLNPDSTIRAYQLLLDMVR